MNIQNYEGEDVSIQVISHVKGKIFLCVNK
jgi:hypothetical protein